MKLTTNIVLSGNYGRTQSYMIQLTPNVHQTDNFVIDDRRYSNDPCTLLYRDTSAPVLVRNVNNWDYEEIEGTPIQLPHSTVRLYFPQYSADTFDNKTIYVLSLSTYVHGTELRLGDFEIRRKDALACSPIRFDGMDEYYEYIDVLIADPYSIHFSQDAASLRELLGVGEDEDDNSSLLHVVLHVVEENGSGYIPGHEWGSGQNSLFISDSDDIDLKLSYVPEENAVNLNISYKGEGDVSLSEYIKNTYNCDYTIGMCDYVIMDENNVYFEESSSYYIVLDTFDESYDFSFSIRTSDLDPDENQTFVGNIFKSWDDWKEGLYFAGSVSFVTNEDEIPFISVISNKVPITREIFAMMIRDENVPLNIDLDSVEMIDVNLTAINKINKIVNNPVTPTDSTKNHLIQPVFYQTREITNVVIHPAVTENISINLDSYKSQVDRFKVQLEGVTFNEIGRTGKGVLFKIVGSMLPKNTNEGTIYILDQNNELVTSGKYNYLF